jgi:hypothetical protein
MRAVEGAHEGGVNSNNYWPREQAFWEKNID